MTAPDGNAKSAEEVRWEQTLVTVTVAESSVAVTHAVSAHMKKGCGSAITDINFKLRTLRSENYEIYR